MNDLFTSVCITCMTSGVALTSVQNFGHGKITYSVKLRTCLPIINSKQYDFNNGFLCEKCVCSVEDYFTFYQNCVQTKWNLEEILKNKNENVTKPTIVITKIIKSQNVTNVPSEKNDGTNDGTNMIVSEGKQNVNKYIVISGKNVNNVNKNIVVETKRNNNGSKRAVIKAKDVNNGNKNINDVGNQVNSIVNKVVEINKENEIITNVVNTINDRNNVTVNRPVSEQVMIKIEDDETFNKTEINELEDPLKIDENDLNGSKNDYETITEIDISEDEIKLEECDDGDVKIDENSIDGSDVTMMEKLHRCNYCEETFERWDELEVHLETDHASKVVYECTICSEIYSEKRNYFAHVIDNHSDEFRFICKPCRIPFRTETELTEHQDLKKCLIKNLNCDYCSLKFDCETSLENHVKLIHNNEKRFCCTLCGMKFLKSNQLLFHTRIRHTNGKLYMCDVCKKSFTKPSLLKRHMQTHTNFSNYICGCGKRFVNIKELLNHQKSQHHTAQEEYDYKIKETKPKSLQCDKCGEIFTIPSKFTKHIREHSESIYSCKYCPIKFKCVSNRNAHIKRMHRQDSLHMCHICGKRLLTPALLEEHFNVHKGIKKHLCHICGELFLHISTLLRHRRRHTGDFKKFPCTYCSKIFKSNVDLLNHTRTHTGEKPFSCEHCGKCFAVKRQVIVHINSVHLEQKPYVCEICNQGCPTMNSLNIHKTKHTNARPFSCAICLSSYKTKNKLHRHLVVSSCSDKGKNRNETNAGDYKQFFASSKKTNK